jgi:hypothetical protein
MEKNIKEFVIGTNKEGQKVRIPVPFNCHVCGDPAVYGNKELWYCYSHWIKEKEKERDAVQTNS